MGCQCIPDKIFVLFFGLRHVKIAENAVTAKLNKDVNLSAVYEVVPMGLRNLGFWKLNGLKLINEIKKK